MSHDEVYHDWKSRRRQVEVPFGFADRVMSQVEAYEAKKKQRSLLEKMLLAMLSSRSGRIAISSLAAAACVGRLLHVIVIFVAH
jgi:hypothetical protein